MFGIVDAVKWVGRAFTGAFDLVKRFTRSKDEQLGRARAVNEQLQEAQDARERMDEERPGSERSTSDELRNGRF